MTTVSPAAPVVFDLVAYAPALAVLGAALITGVVALLVRRGSERRPAAMTYDELFKRVDKLDQKVTIYGDGFGALLGALTSSDIKLELNPDQQLAVDRASLLRLGGDPTELLKKKPAA